MKFALSFKHYQQSWLGPDILAAILLLVIAVPEQLATARLAGMPPITGLYAFIAGSLLIALLGSNPQMSVGADSTIAPLIVVGIMQSAQSGTDAYIASVSVLAIVVGLLVASVGIFHLGWIADFLSIPIITGFLAGVGIIIIAHQLNDFFGIHGSSGTTIDRVVAVFKDINHINLWTLGIGVGVFAIVFGSDRIDRRIPGALIAVIASILLVTFGNLNQHGVAILGAIQHSAPHIILTGINISVVAKMLPLAAVIALIVVAQSAATSRAFAEQGQYTVNIGRDFMGVGFGSVVSGLAGSFAVDASPARTGAVATVGGRTQLSGIGAALCVLLLIPIIGLLSNVPFAALAAILVFVAIRLFRIKDLVQLMHFDLWECGLAVITLLTVSLVGVQQGIGIAVAFAILDHTRLSARPKFYLLGKIPGTTSWEPINHHPKAKRVPGVIVFMYSSSLYFANAEYFRTVLSNVLASEAEAHLVVLDAVAISDIDYTGTQVFADSLKLLSERNITFSIARLLDPVRNNLQRSGLLTKIGNDHIFESVNAAVTALK